MCDAVGGLLAAIAAWSFRSMSPQPIPSARTSMSLWSFWKSSTMAFIAARVDGLGSVSHIVTTTFFCARAGPAPDEGDRRRARRGAAEPGQELPPAQVSRLPLSDQPPQSWIAVPTCHGGPFARGPLEEGAGPDVVGSRTA